MLQSRNNRCSFGIGDRFSNAHSYFKNNPILNGRLKKYCHSRNVDHIENIEGNICPLKKSKTVLNIRKSKKLEIDTSNNINIICDIKRKKHNLSCINNKSSGCITPDSFNPLTNHKHKENKIKTKNVPLKNKDHFYHMNPTVINTYKPLIKRNININTQKEKRKSGKKIFGFKNIESKEECNSRNTFRNRIELCNTTNNFWVNNKNNRKIIYEYEAPVISYKNYKGININ